MLAYLGPMMTLCADMTRSTGNFQAAQDLQQVTEATKASVQAQPDRFEDVPTPSLTPNMQQVLKVQTPNMSQVPRCV